MTLVARDQAGQSGQSQPYEFVLPERTFTKPLAKAVVEQRKKLVRDPGAPDSVANALDALTLGDEKVIDDSTIYLALRNAYWRLRGDQSREGIASVVDQLWDVALRIEEGDLPEAERAVKQAQDALSKALQENSSPEQIKQLVDELRDALSKYLQALASQQQDKGNMTFLSDIRDYPWTSLLTGLLPARIVNLLPARFQTRAAQIVPSASIAGNALTVVIAIMSFLACLTAGAVYMVNQSANAWVNDIASEITVELDPINTADIEKKMTLVSLFLAKQKGITRVKPLTADDSAKLLEPWLGETSALSALPIPRLIAVEIDRSNPPDIELIKTALTQNFEGVTLDDHRRWQAEIKTVTRTAALGGLVVLSLVAAATIAVIVSATRSAM